MPIGFENAGRGSTSMMDGNFQEIMSHCREYLTLEQRWTVSSTEQSAN